MIQAPVSSTLQDNILHGPLSMPSENKAPKPTPISLNPPTTRRPPIFMCSSRNEYKVPTLTIYLDAPPARPYKKVTVYKTRPENSGKILAPTPAETFQGRAVHAVPAQRVAVCLPSPLWLAHLHQDPSRYPLTAPRTKESDIKMK